MIGIDTHVLVRYFTQDDTTQSPKARRFVLETLSPARQGHVSLVTLAELAWVLNSIYKASVEAIVAVVSTLLSEDRFVVQDARAAWAALDVYRSGKVDFADALIAAVDRLHGCTHTTTFDRGAARIEGMTLLA